MKPQALLVKASGFFITAKLPSYIKVGYDDLIENYLFLTTSHDGSGSIIAAFTPVRIVCNNTLNAALCNCSNVIKIRHTANAIERLKEAHKVMGMVNTLTPTLESVFNQFAKIRITDPQVMELIRRAMCPNKEVLAKLESGNLDETSTMFQNMCSHVYEYAMTSDTQQLETTKGTLFGAYNAVTGYFQNARTYKNADAKMNSILYGGTAQNAQPGCI
jgi:phage/plasmid-like protein (TIGR03299 family)